MLKKYDFIDKRFVETDDSPGQVLLLVSPSEAEKVILHNDFLLDDYDLACVLDEDEVPRLDVSDGRLLLIWKRPVSAVVSDSLELGVNVVGVILHKERLALVCAKGDISFEHREYRNVKDVRDVLLAFLLRSVHQFIAHLRVIKQISNDLEKKITISMENKHLLQMFSLSEDLVYYLDAMETNASVLTKLRNIGERYGFEPHDLEALDDIILENNQGTRQARIFSSVLSGLMDARGTIVNNNMNVLLKNLTLINIVFLPLNLIASIGGMSEWSMMTQGIDWKLSYALFSLGMIIIGWLTWIFMKKIFDNSSDRESRPASGAAVDQRTKKP